MTYAVRAVVAGKIAYARVNDSQTSGYGFTIIIDHGNDHYTLYAHLATNATEALSPTIGKQVGQNEVIGFMADLANDERSSGNVAACVVAPFDKIQVHFEHILALSGRTSTAGTDMIKAGGTLADPTADLKALGYLEFPPPVAAPTCPPTLSPES